MRLIAFYENSKISQSYKAKQRHKVTRRVGHTRAHEKKISALAFSLKKERQEENRKSLARRLQLSQSGLQHGYHNMALRFQILSLYKQLLRLAQDTKAPAGHLPYVEQIKAGFRLYRSETNVETIHTLIAKAKSKLGFLSMVSPRRKSSMASGKQHFVYRQGEGLIQVDNTRPRSTTFRDNRIDPDDLARHQRLLECVLFSVVLFFFAFLVVRFGIFEQASLTASLTLCEKVVRDS